MKKFSVFMIVVAVLFIFTAPVKAEDFQWEDLNMHLYSEISVYQPTPEEVNSFVYFDLTGTTSPFRAPYNTAFLEAWNYSGYYDGGLATKSSSFTISVLGRRENYAYSDFSGNVTAEANTISVSYSYEDILSLNDNNYGTGYAKADTYTWFTMINQTTGTTLSNRLLNRTSYESYGVTDVKNHSGNINLGEFYVTVGDTINYNVHTVSKTFIDSDIMDANAETTGKFYITASTTVVPEPISSILFVAGGVTLGLRRLRKK